ncbi:MAG TPA: type II toxin-antitoxin system HicA family toxin [Bacteroidota bacterium]|nr:type II toxin-antitoxin system HicA family toxin [Candidatus Kapabacteria bacterium]HRS00971.1 type II toxin-antitoxin system HicA family toxin [Bacteroidota bacterium]
MKPRELIKLLEENGFIFVRQSGSHAIYKKSQELMVVVPIHNREIPKGTLNGILKDAGLK